MMKITLIALLFCLAAASPNAKRVHNLSNTDRITGEFLIVLHAPAGKATNMAYATQVASRIVGMSPTTVIVNLFTNLRAPILHVKTSDEASMSQLFQIDEIDSIDSNLQQHMIEQCSSQSTTSRIWGLSRSSSRAAPSYATASYSYSSAAGNGVRVYILDTSIRVTHQDFTGRGFFGANFVGGSNDDNNGHGTHCAGTATGTEFGIAKRVNVVAVKVLGDSGSGATSGIIAGIDWMVSDVQSRGIRGVGSMSLGGGANTALDSAVNSASSANVPMVVAAGNSNDNACNYSPARASGAITVGSTDNADTLSSFSNWGSCVDILAPGTSILSASHLSDTGSRTLSGTSMACPHVAGRAGVYLAANPNASSSQVKSFLTTNASSGYINLRGTSGTPNLLMYAAC